MKDEVINIIIKIFSYSSSLQMAEEEILADIQGMGNHSRELVSVMFGKARDFKKSK